MFKHQYLLEDLQTTMGSHYLYGVDWWHEQEEFVPYTFSYCLYFDYLTARRRHVTFFFKVKIHTKKHSPF